MEEQRLHRVGVRISDLYRIITSPARLLPDFVIIGGQKCGTTSLYNYLIEHPNVLPARNKETGFFHTRRYGMGQFLYRASFPKTTQERRAGRTNGSKVVTGESTPEYLFYPQVPGRVRKVVPRARLIALLRNPVDRTYSHYQHKVREGWEPLSFEEAIDREPERLKGERERLLADPRYQSHNFLHFSYLARSVYVDQLKAWREFFPEDQILVLKSEDFYEDPSSSVARTLEFLGLAAVGMESYARYNAGGYAGQIDPALRKRLVDYFRPHNQRLYEYLGRDLGWDG